MNKVATYNLPIDFLKAWVKASVLDISREKISEPASIVNGVSSPSDLAIPILKWNKIRLLNLDYLRNGSFTSTGLTTDEDGSTSDLLVSDHLEDNTSGSSCVDLNK